MIVVDVKLWDFFKVLCMGLLSETWEAEVRIAERGSLSQS